MSITTETAISTPTAIEQKHVIWKFPLKDLTDIDNVTVIEMPTGAVILHIDAQHGMPTLWAEVTPDAPPEEHRIHVYCTGQELAECTMRYIGTILYHDGALVLHFFDELL